jgi:molybdopterin-guanine dinucleotide biosynthesis protein A
MGQDKGSLCYHGANQRTHVTRLLAPFCRRVFVSCRREQAPLLAAAEIPIFDRDEGLGPAAGLLAAFRFAPAAGWLVLACDLPLVELEDVGKLVSSRCADKAATVYFNSLRNELEPLFAVWEPQALRALRTRSTGGDASPTRALRGLVLERVTPFDPKRLRNVNTMDEANVVRLSPIMRSQPLTD